MKRLAFVLLLIATPYLSFSQVWCPVGSGVQNGGLTGFAPLEKLYIGAYVTSLSGVPVNGICTLDNNEVDTLGPGLGLGGACNAVWYNGKLITGGDFVYAGQDQWSIPCTRYLAAWDSLNGWQSITPNGAVDYKIFAMTTYNGNLYIGGQFVTINNVPVNRIAKWNGSSWSNVSGGVNGGIEEIFCMAVYHGQLYVGGDFGYAGTNNLPAYNIARWNGTQWDSVGGGLNAPPLSLVVDTVRDVLYAGGFFTGAGHGTAMGVAQWNDTVWSAVGHPTDTLSNTRCMTMFNGDLYAGGGSRTTTAQGDTLNYIYHFDGTNWRGVSGGANYPVLTMTTYNGNLYVGGQFWQVGYGVNANKIACYGVSCPTAVGISEMPPPVPFKMYPNPNDDVLHIESEEPQPLKFQLMNSEGKIVAEEFFSGRLDYSIKGLAAGTYFARIGLKDGSRMHIEKVIINN